MEQQQQQIQHFSHPENPLVFNPDERSGTLCSGCEEPISGPSYRCTRSKWECRLQGHIYHKSCVELPLGLLHHPLHPIHPLVLLRPNIWAYFSEDTQFYKCELCKKDLGGYMYRCSRCDFNVHITCASLAPTMREAEFHPHPLTPIQKWITFTCDLCGKEDKGMPYLCHQCDFWIHGRCSIFPQILKVVRHKHLLHLTHSSLEFLQPDPRFCLLCAQKLDTRYGLYYCFRCSFVAHLDCATFGNREDINLQEFKDVDEALELNKSVDSTTYKVKKSNMQEDGMQMVEEEIEHISHEHDLKLTNEVPNNQICDGCVRVILSPSYSCVKCRFFLHESCAKLPPKIQHPLHQHPLILLPMKSGESFLCNACYRYCNGFTYKCVKCYVHLDIHCSLISDIITHEGHEHQLILSYIGTSSFGCRQQCSCCRSNSDHIFRCTTCEFALDYDCATLPHTTRYNQHEHPFTLCYRPEDDSSEYYCDICEEERDSKHWFYYCEGCSYLAHPKCILGENPNCK